MTLLTVLLIVLALTLLLAGAAGTVYPALPGLPMMFGGAWLLAYAQDYQIITVWTLVLLLLPTLFGMAMDFVAGMLGAKYTGADKQAVWGAFIGGIAGIFFGIIGLLLGPLIGAAIGEFVAKRDLLKAGKVGIGTFVGFVVGTAAKIGAALVIVLVVAAQYVVHWWA
ncbi:DUF456 domain-containing protein [Conchiformibius steedae]|uniref:DUF456 domain-containing protein n=1 Tax=Conchiformibius steedae TaxID=153493 RepID=A0A3P2A8L3_9NEIS|nr:DUF456 family protein [Conchiformibius steedae]RRD91714.1 DUF456 domain-containing protein [Conchiformibius steedae]